MLLSANPLEVCGDMNYGCYDFWMKMKGLAIVNCLPVKQKEKAIHSIDLHRAYEMC